MDEIVKQPHVIEFLAGENDAHFVIVPVQILALSLVVAEVVRRRECLFNADFVHEPSSESPKRQVARVKGRYSE